LAIGGLETLQSYGIGAGALPSAEQGDQWRMELIRRLPPEHLAVLSNLEIKFECGDYLFVHAGVKPGVALEDQDAQDLIWIRDEFLGSTQDFGRMVVHGHSIGATPQIQTNRICVDTGAYYSGHLTTAVLEGNEVWFLQT
jgi:serine/threonine protein phosphatase 1